MLMNSPGSGWRTNFYADEFAGQWLAYEIPLTPKELYGYGSVYNPFVRLFQDREVNDIDLILVIEEMNPFQRERHKWCSDNRWRTIGAGDRSPQPTSRFYDGFAYSRLACAAISSLPTPLVQVAARQMSYSRVLRP
jgi:hypothetical protein